MDRLPADNLSMEPLSADNAFTTRIHGFGSTIVVPDNQDIDLLPYLQARQSLRQMEGEVTEKSREPWNVLIAIIDESSTVLAVNAVWRAATRTGGMGWDTVGIGAKYLSVCEGVRGEWQEEATNFALGLRAVLSGRSERFEAASSSSHSLTEPIWYNGRVILCAGEDCRLFAIIHENVTPSE